ncbi:MAG: RNA polymerase sigma factor [Candidatus Izemoplasmatales bacterium]|nr:RNA polymerase sigma factor [Candidatus Izemoplasmatales bacterium]
MGPNYDQLVDLLKNKDDLAFQIVYENTKKGVFSIIAGIIKSKATIEDLMQDTYIKMIQNINSYKKGRNFPAWVMQIAKNTAIDYYRKQKRVDLHDPQTDMYLFDQAVPTAESSDLEIETILKPLQNDEKEVVLMKVYGNLRFKDIALALEKPLGTVLWIYNKAIKKLKESMGGETK